MRSDRWIRAGLVLALCFGLAGCTTRDSGYKISNETIAFIKPGVTTQSEVVENLGPPLLELKDLHACAYSWGKMRLANSSREGMQPGPMDNREQSYILKPPTDEGTLVETRRWLCCIAMDDQGKVTRVERVKVEGSPSLEKTLRDWAAAK